MVAWILPRYWRNELVADFLLLYWFLELRTTHSKRLQNDLILICGYSFLYVIKIDFLNIYRDWIYYSKQHIEFICVILQQIWIAVDSNIQHLYILKDISKIDLSLRSFCSFIYSCNNYRMEICNYTHGPQKLHLYKTNFATHNETHFHAHMYEAWHIKLMSHWCSDL